jgi:chromate transport protein ChrA
MKRALIIVGAVAALYVLPVPHSPMAYVLLLLLLGYSEVIRIRKSLERGERTDKSKNHGQ